VHESPGVDVVCCPAGYPQPARSARHAALPQLGPRARAACVQSNARRHGVEARLVGMRSR
jgi:hypothetical protein